jgi:exoribonuclease-2
MESGFVVEYIDKQRILCAVVLEVKQQRLRLLTENAREVSLSPSRLSHLSSARLDLAMGRDRIVDTLKDLASRRHALMREIDIRELWEVLNTEQEWIDLDTMTAFCFPQSATSDHESAVIRAFFGNRRYFKFKNDGFFPHSENYIAQLIAREQKAERQRQLIQDGSEWLHQALADPDFRRAANNGGGAEKFGAILKSYCIFGKDSPTYDIGRAMASACGVELPEDLFPRLVQLGILDPDENIELIREGIPEDFPEDVAAAADRLARHAALLETGGPRRDLTDLPLMTIDGQSTLDYDDALSIQDLGDARLIGVHIVDVAHHVKRGSVIDREALSRGSSIYMPDHRIPMLPPVLAEGICSLKAGEIRPAISTFIKVNAFGVVVSYDICASLIRVRHQRTYYDVNLAADDDPDIVNLRRTAEAFREHRLDQGAVQITLPDVNVWIDEDRQVNLSRLNRESPARLLVSELMIMANWIMARFLRDNGLPAIFRSQPEPKERLYKRNEGTLFQNWMQRRRLNRFVLHTAPERHSGLGLDAYITATSPIRKYFDLITQRQIRAALGMADPYTAEEISSHMQQLEQPMAAVSRVQHNRHHYWLLRYLEGRVGEKTEAIVLQRRRNAYQVLLTEFMVECDMPLDIGRSLKPETVVEVTIQNVNARKGLLSVFTV